MKNFSTVLKQAYDDNPDKTSIVLLERDVDDRVVTYGDLIREAAGYARALEQAGIEPGELVIQIQQHGMDLVSAFYGAILRGAIPSILPFLTEKLSPEIYRRSLMALIKVSRPAAIITYPEFKSEVDKALEEGNSVRAVLLENEISRDPHPDWSLLRGLERDPSEIVLLQHSSGTTGLQKGVALSHEAIFNQLENYARAIDLTAEDVIVSWLPLYHDMGLIAGFILPILRQIPLVMMSPFDWVRAPYRLMQAITKYQGTLAWLPNFAYNFCAQKIRDRHLEGADLSSWRAVINCSEPIYASSHQMFLERFKEYGFRPEALASSYAMAENVFAVTQGGIHEPLKMDVIDKQAFQEQKIARPATGSEETLTMVSSGVPIHNTEIRIFDEERRELQDRQLGEIALRSDCMLTGYYNRPDVTAEAFHGEWYLTGDLGYRVGDELYVSGRKKDLIIVGGKNIYPQDIEALAGEVQGVHPGRVVSFGVYSEQVGSEEVVVIAESDEEDPEERKRIANQIRQSVTKGSDIALRYVEVVDRDWLIKTSSGKIARSANRGKYQSVFRGEDV
ncbi:MAG TPA: fatty acyl-AMP ligase [Anaerolineae bacterium]|nr:fatty acyl-AMP ligase [Anaerolineae bacterium]